MSLESMFKSLRSTSINYHILLWVRSCKLHDPGVAVVGESLLPGESLISGGLTGSIYRRDGSPVSEQDVTKPPFCLSWRDRRSGNFGFKRITISPATPKNNIWKLRSVGVTVRLPSPQGTCDGGKEDRRFPGNDRLTIQSTAKMTSKPYKKGNGVFSAPI